MFDRRRVGARAFAGPGTAIADKQAFTDILSSGSGDDVGAMELVAMELKAKGAFIARQV